MKKGYAPAVVLLAGILWGTLGLFSRHLKAAGFGPFEITFVRVSISFLATVIPVALFARALLVVHLRDLWCFLGSGIVSVLFFSACYFRGLELTSLAVATVLLYTAPIFVVLLSALIFHDPITKKKLAALVLAFVGYILVAGIGGGQPLSFKGFLCCLGAGFFYSLYSIFGKLAMQRGYSALTLTLYSFLFCTLGSAVMVDWNVFGSAVRQDSNILWWMLGTGLIAAFCPYTLYSIGLSKMDAGKASILVSIELVAEATIGFIVFHEPLSVVSIAGIMLVLSAIVILNLHSHKSRKNEKARNS